MANEYYERLSEMNPGDLADGLAMEAEFDAISQGFSKLPTPHTGGQGFDGPVRVGDAVNTDEAVSLGQLNAAIGEAVLLPIGTYGNLAAAAWGTLASNTYLLFGTGAQFSNTPYTLVAGSTYYLQVRHVIGGAGVAIYHDELSLASADDPTNPDLRRLFMRTGSTLTGANTGGWVGFTLKKAALTALESLVPAADRMAYYTAAGTAAMTSLTAFSRTLLASASAGAARSALDAYGKNNIVGAVSQSGGVPTSAIIERGSNANGEYVRFADGTVIAWAVSTPVVTSAPTDGVNSANITWTYPVEVLSPVLLVAVSAPGRVMWSPGHPTVSSTAGSIYISSMTPFSWLTVACRRMVVGRWY